MPISQNNLYGMLLVYLRLNCAMKATCKKNTTCPTYQFVRGKHFPTQVPPEKA